MQKNKIGITQWSLPGEGQYSLQMAKHMGFHALQLDLGNSKNGFALTSSFLQQQYLQDAEKYHIDLPSLAVNEVNRMGFSHPKDNADKKAAYTALETAVRVASDMHIPSVVFPSFGTNRILDEADFKRTVDALRFVCRLAEQENITVYSENVLTPQRFVALHQAVDSSSLRLLFDSQNYYFFNKVDCSTHLDQLFPYIGNQVHLKDGDNQMGMDALGKGASSFYKSVDKLKSHNFIGYLILENCYDKKPHLLHQDMHTIKELFDV